MSAIFQDNSSAHNVHRVMHLLAEFKIIKVLFFIQAITINIIMSINNVYNITCVYVIYNFLNNISKIYNKCIVNYN